MLTLGSLAMAQTNPLKPYQWQNRIILLFANNQENKLYQEQKQELERVKLELDDRDLLVFHIFEQEAFQEDETLDLEVAAYLKEKYSGDAEFSLVLIGKDGGVKRTSQASVSSADLFNQIDAMPMRIDEMQD